MKRSIKQLVKEGYGKIARQGTSCCPGSSCCGSNLAKDISKTVGYTDKEMNVVPKGSNLGLGCGNPVAIASLKNGETVLDLGSGAGFDAFLAAKKVGKRGRVIGVDMTPEMIARARENARKGKYSNVEFKLGEIEALPIGDNSVDVIISNCVINLSLDKEKVFREAFRVLRTDGRIMISDLVLLGELPKSIKRSIEAYVGCLAGAIMKDKYIGFIKKAGFTDIKVADQTGYPVKAMMNDATVKTILKDGAIQHKELDAIEKAIVSIKIHAAKK